VRARAQGLESGEQVEIRVLGADEGTVLEHVAPDVFDFDVDPRWARDFFADPRHHLAVAVDGGQVVGMASGVHYVHPDKGPELFVNEVGVADNHQGRGIGRRLLRALFDHARALGCGEAWVLTSESNAAARRLYEAAGGAQEDAQLVMYNFRLSEPAPASRPKLDGGEPRSTS
jgi:ribosomal protein S18 acetylase RimI-like enzyme